MPSNLIISRVAGFLGSHTPFDLLEITVIEKISATVEIIYFDNKKIIFREGDTPGPYCYVLRKGQVNLLRKMENKDILMDVCGEGDMFGVRSMLSGENYKLTAIVETEALVYAIPVKQVRTIVDENPEVSRYFAVGLASGQIIRGTDQKVKGSVHSINFQFTDQPVGILPYVLDRELITCRPGDKIKDVAEMMAVKGTGSAIVVDKRNFPLGIITDTDLRKQVATGKVVITAPVRSIMSSPVITIRSDQHLGDMVLKMMKAGVHHVCITEDGTNGSPAIGIVSNHDLLMSQGSNPTIVYKAIRKAESLDELKTLYRESEKIIGQYMAGEVPVSYLLEVSSFLRDALT
ncbi:MAG: CBS domain-containing protein, partial [Cyclobacteriaceae bacterium]|nr:CBS domain-containing protein [Cyclobacteriaceae bacterium]